MRTSWTTFFRRMASVTAMGTSVFVASAANYAWAVASDNAGNAPYADGWQNGDNGGTGFGPWAISSSASTYSIDNGPAPDNALGAPAWQLHNSNNYASVTADRPFNSPLGVSQTFSFQIDPPTSFSPGNYGYGGMFLRLRSSAGNELSLVVAKNLPFGLTPPEKLLIDDGTGTSFDTGITATTASAGLNVAVTPTGAGTYDIDISDLGGTSLFSASRNLVTLNPINTFRMLLDVSPLGGMYANNLSIVPEPGTGVLLLVGAGGLVLAKVRRRKD